MIRWVSYQTMLGVMIQAPFAIGNWLFLISLCKLFAPIKKELKSEMENFFSIRMVKSLGFLQTCACWQWLQCSLPTGQTFSSLALPSPLSRSASTDYGEVHVDLVGSSSVWTRGPRGVGRFWCSLNTVHSSWSLVRRGLGSLGASFSVSKLVKLGFLEVSAGVLQGCWNKQKQF